MATKLGRKTMPSGLSASDFKYVGRPAKDQGDFGTDVGIADCACVNQFGDANNSKYYHGGVVEASGRWFVYLEWGRISGSGKSWNGSFRGGDYQFVECSSEADARAFFAKQLRSKNIARLERKTVGGVEVWAGKNGKDGYIVQSLATRERGLPDAYTIKDDTGVTTTAVAAPKKAAKKSGPKLSRDYHREEIKLATDLLGGAQTYTRSLSKASGVVPTMDAIQKVRDDLIPAALTRIQSVGNDIAAQVADKDLQDISRMVFSMVPRQIPRQGLTPEQAILSNNNILLVQNDLDAFETALGSEDFTVETTTTAGIDPDSALNAKLTWLDPNSDLGRWVINTYTSMTRNRHGDLSGQRLRVRNVFAVERPDRDTQFVTEVNRLAAAKRARGNSTPPGLQPKTRPDLADLGTQATDAGVFLGIHGTRGVNVAPILQSHLRMPRALSGVHITGAAFGHGIYFATDLKKSWGYTGYSRRWGGGGGSVANRGAFMFLCDVAGGQFHYVKRAWSINSDKCPGGGDSVYAHPNFTSVQNDEHVIFNPAHCRIRYVVEMDFQ